MATLAPPTTRPGNIESTRDGATERRLRRDPVTGHELWQITESAQASFHSYYDLCPWNAAGDKLVFCGVSPDRPGSDVYWMETASGGLHLAGHSVKQNPHTGVHQQWIGTGDVIAYEDRDAAGDFVRIVDLAGGAERRLPGAARMVSPDGSRIASHTPSTDVEAIMRRAEAGVFITSLEDAVAAGSANGAGGVGGAGGAQSGALRRIATIQDALDLNPRAAEIGHCHIYVKHAKFSPDGKRLSFVFTNEILYQEQFGEPRVKDIYVVNVDGSDLRFACSFTWGNHPSWHPNGRQILFNHRDRPGSPLVFMLADAETGAMAPATTLAPGGGHPPYSPDGTKIAAEYVSRGQAGEPASARVACVDLEAGRVEDLVRFRVTDHSHQGTHIHPTWSRDGRAVLLNVDEAGHSELWLVPVA